MPKVLGLGLATLVAAASMLGLASRARADGDPASDVLYYQDVFVPYGASLPSAVARELLATTHTAKLVGFPVRVALIRAPMDLGTAAGLFGKPQAYARFLGIELNYFYDYSGVLVVAMENGFGVYRQGKPIADEQRLLRRVRILPDIAGMATSSIAAIKELAAAAGHPLPKQLISPRLAGTTPTTPHSPSSPPASASTLAKGGSSSSGSGSNVGIILGAVAGATAVGVGVAGLLYRRQRRAGPPHRQRAADR